MNGLENSKRLFDSFGRQMLENNFSPYLDRIACGLAGQGSECFGFDDEISRDHDYGAGFCIWVPEQVYCEVGEKLQQEYRKVLNEAQEAQKQVFFSEGRTGALSIDRFYRNLIGRNRAPETLEEWLSIPERYLAVATNGEVFCDPLGEFTEIRNKLLGFYPEEVRKKKLAANLATMAQAGQYNYSRSLRRRHYTAAYLAAGEFVRAALGTVFLLNKKYMPFYKWSFRAAENLDRCKDVISNLRLFIMLSDISDQEQKKDIIEKVCSGIINELIFQNLSDDGDSFLQYHAERIYAQITDTSIGKKYILVGGTQING